MRKTILLPIIAAVAVSLPSLAHGQVAAHASATFQLNLPVVLPPPVVIVPGVQVVPEIGHEVFLVDGIYWARHGDGWYKSRSHRGGWVAVPGRGVPVRLARLEPGKYRNWKRAAVKAEHRDGGEGRGGGEGHGKHKKHGKH